METALDLSASTNSNTRVKTELADTCRSTSPDQSPSSSTNMSFSNPLYRSLFPLDNTTLAALLATRGFLSPASAPPYPSLFNQSIPSPEAVTPPAGNEPVSLLPSASLALSTLHRRRRASYHKRSDHQLSTTDQPDSKKTKSSNEGSDEKKDESYWERRRKNNEAAKRSRDARRAKEEEIVARAAYLEQENLKLKAQVAVLKNETAKLHFMLLNHVQSSSN